MNTPSETLQEELMRSYAALLVDNKWNVVMWQLSDIVFTTVAVHFITRQSDNVKQVAEKLVPLILDVAAREKTRDKALNKCYDLLKGARKNVEQLLEQLSTEAV